MRYRDDLETELPDKGAIIDEVIATMARLMDKTFERQRHGVWGTHAKSYRVVTGNTDAGDNETLTIRRRRSSIRSITDIAFRRFSASVEATNG